MSIRTLAWIEEALRDAGIDVQARLVGRDATAWRGATIDSRRDCSGRLYFAISGERADGHDYVRDAFAAGAVAAVIERAEMSQALVEEGIVHLVVPDTRAALICLGRSYRAHIDISVIAITGSSGKTTTKEYLYAIMRTVYRAHANPGNYNSTIGVPLTLLDIDEDTEYLVCEIGANRGGEIGLLADMVRPEIGVITNIGDAHVGEFGSRDAIAAAKGELLDHLGENDHIVLPRGDHYFDRLRERAAGKVVTFGTEETADYVARRIRSEEGRLSFSVNGEEFSLAAAGTYHALNACAAGAAAELCGIPLARAARALRPLAPGPGRGRTTTVAGVTVIDESYNASPSSMALSIDMLAEAGPSRTIAVLGDMAELGAHSEELHAEIGRHIAKSGIGRVYWKGSRTGAVQDGIKDAGGKVRLGVYEDSASLAGAVAQEAGDGDVVLVKASRSCELDVFVSEFFALLRERTEENGG